MSPKILACQRDSCLREFETSVVSCESASINFKGEKLDGFNVVFDDTILFPEGGGQNDDYGTVNGHPVLRVARKNGQAVHFVASKSFKDEIESDSGKVRQVVDWPRRFDHMQQHSGQHLISAFAEKLFAAATTSWWMSGEESASFIELNVATLPQGKLDQLEDACNAAIRQHIEVDVQVFELGDENLDKAKTRGLPADFEGPVRVINIGDIDSNMCCGTHVANLSQLQLVKLLDCEKSKRKGKTLLYFVAGNRAIKRLSRLHRREKSLTAILKNGPEVHGELVEKMAKNLKISQKSAQNLQRELATKVAGELGAKKPDFYSVHRPENEPDFANALVGELADEEILLFLTNGDEKSNSFQLVLHGPKEQVNLLTSRILTTLDAKGGGKGKRVNAKFSSLKNRKAADAILSDFFKSSDKNHG